MSKQEFIQVLRSKRALYAYVIVNSNTGVHVKQSKSEWLQIAMKSDIDSYDVTITDSSIYIN